MVFNEDSRVKIPCILHLVRLGYRYLSLKNATWDEETNIFPDQFRSAIAQINPGIDVDNIDRLLVDVKLSLENEDLGKDFYEKLTERSGIRLIDFTDFTNNSFHVVTELTCKNGDDEFRPDITLLINGLPLVFIEVKKPNNREGVLAERNRIITRSKNPRFRRFINITQLMVFSNNMEYEDGSPQPIEGAFYASPSYDAPNFNYFREEEDLNLADLLADVDDVVENEVLRDNNLNVIKHSPEFISNKSPDTPTNRVCTSLLSRDRLSFLLQYALVYVNESDGLHKHVMRYPQLTTLIPALHIWLSKCRAVGTSARVSRSRASIISVVPSGTLPLFTAFRKLASAPLSRLLLSNAETPKSRYVELSKSRPCFAQYSSAAANCRRRLSPPAWPDDENLI